MYDSETIPETICRWGTVKVVRFGRTARHADLLVWNDFVEGLEQFLWLPRDWSRFDKKAMKSAHKHRSAP